MQRIPLNSRSLRSVGYHAGNALLELEFHDGAVYQYFGVPAESYQSLLRATSHGGYFNAHIRHHFAFAKLPPTSSPVAEFWQQIHH